MMDVMNDDEYTTEGKEQSLSPRQQKTSLQQ